jgi:hypothetical protein
MKYAERKLNLKLSCLILVLLSACAEQPKLTPYFIDTDLSECREYEVIDKENFKVQFKASHPIDHCNGFFAVPAKEAAEWKQYLLEFKNGKN